MRQSGVLPSLQNSANPEGKSFLRIFDLKDGEVYVNEALIKEGDILFPTGFFEGGSPYMGRNTQTSVYPLDLVMRIYLPDSTHSNQDFYFEIPVLGPHYEISSLSSALTRFLRYEITPIPKLSYLQYEKILYSLKVNCNVCIKLPSSEILKEIRFSQFYQQMIFSNLEGGPYTRISSPNSSLVVAFSYPVIEGVQSRIEVVNEGDSTSLELVLMDPEDSSKRIFPQNWIESYLNMAKDPIASLGSSLNLHFDYLSEGLHTYKANIINRNELSQDFEFLVLVKNQNIKPIWSDLSTLQFRENHGISFNLRNKAMDPDATAESELLTFSLINFPSGMIIKNSYELYWRPIFEQIGQYRIAIEANDNNPEKEGKTQELINIEVIPDKLPFLKSNHVSVINAPENLETTVVILIGDDDGDPVRLLLEKFNELSLSQTTELLDDGKTTQITLKIKPSFLKTIGGNLSESLLIPFDYDTYANPHLLSLGSRKGFIELNINYVNLDDPPIFMEPALVGGHEEEPLFVTEGVYFRFPALDGSSGYASFGRFVDSNINPTPLTFSFENLSGSNCNWESDTSNPGYLSYIQDNGNFILEGKPSLSSSVSCIYRIVAIDANGLMTYSNPIYFSVTNVNRSPTFISNAPELEVQEGMLLFIDLKSNYFDDEDLIFDYNEKLTMTCIDCPEGVYLSGSYFSWIPSYATVMNSVESIFLLTIRATDQSGAFVDGIISVKVLNSKAPPIMTFGSNTLFKVIPENSMGSIDLTITAGSTDAADIYDYIIEDILCVGASPCLSGGLYMIDQSGHIIESGSQFSTGISKTFKIIGSPNFNDGNAPFPSSSSAKVVEVSVSYNMDGVQIIKKASMKLTIQNINRSPSKLILLDTSENLQGNIIEIPYSLSMTTYNYLLQFEDFDGSNDSYTFYANNSALLGSNILSGKFIKKNWSFTIDTMCIRPDLPYKSVNMTYNFHGIDGRSGQTNTLQTTFKITGARNVCF